MNSNFKKIEDNKYLLKIDSELGEKEALIKTFY